MTRISVRLFAAGVLVTLVGGCSREGARALAGPGAEVVPPPCASPAPLLGTPNPAAPGIIVSYRSSVDPVTETARLAALYGFTPSHVYAYAIKGFAADVPPATVADLRCETTVSFVEYDAVVTVTD
jgi:hypothetical protein